MINDFCMRWGLAINVDKSKVVIFSKNGRVSKDRFMFSVGQTCLECVDQYKYLGVNVAANEKMLSLKASRALFSIKQSIFDSTIKRSAVMHIFDSHINPIALYNSEIWAGYKTCYQNKSLDEMFDMSFKCNNEFDKFFTRFSKYVLGVNSKATNFAVFSELGQFSMLISVIARCINFWIHTIQSSNESLMSEAYWEQCNNPVLKSSWLRFIKYVLKIYTLFGDIK